MGGQTAKAIAIPAFVREAGVRALARPAGWASLGVLGLIGGLVSGSAAMPDAAGAPLLAILAVVLLLAGFAAFGWGAWRAGRTSGRDPVADVVLAATEVSPTGYAIADAQGRFTYANGAFRAFLAPCLDDPLSVASIARRLAVFAEAGADAASSFARLRAAAEAGARATAEIALTAESGILEWRLISVQPLPGTAAGAALWRIEDITDRREVEAVRGAEEDRLADYLDLLPVGFFSVDAEGRIVHFNRTLATWLGIPGEADKIRGLPFRDFVAGSATAGEETLTAIGWEASEEHGAVFLRRRDGSTFRAYLLQSERLGADGGFVYSRSVVLRDPAALYHAVAGGSVHRLRWLFDEAPVGIAILDLKGRVVDSNRALLKLMGLHREGVVGRPFVDRVTMEDRGDVAAQLSKVVMGTSRAAHLEVRLPGSGPNEIVASLYASRFEDAAGEVAGLVLHFIDATEQKHLETQFTQSQKMQAVGQLAGGIAHDFNNLLTAMLGFCDLLLQRHGPADPSFGDIMQIKQNANRAANLVRQLLAFSRKQTMRPVLIDAKQAIADLLHLLRRLIGEKIELVIESSADPAVVRVDPVQFDQVVINLAVNSRDAMPGGGTLTIATSGVTLAQAARRGADVIPAGSYVLIEVRDTGSGIAKENIGRIFEPFFSTKERGEGTGLGLSTVYGIIRQTEGYIFVDSASGEGATFSIFLPQYAQHAQRAGMRPGAGSPAHGPLVGVGPDTVEGRAEADLTGTGTVLLVEDEEAVRMFGARALRSKGYRVLEASNGEAALDVINSNDSPVDLIISDVVMPGMDGHTLVRLVRHEHPRVKIILMSGYAEDIQGEEINRDPQIRFLPKPFTLKALTGLVKDVLAEPAAN